jgi:hypothetical protein
MKIYLIRGTRRCGVVMAETPEEALAQAHREELVKPWEKAEAVERPLPKGYKIIYDPLVGAMEQAVLPLPAPEAAPEPPHLLTRSGIKVYDDWRDNIIVDADAPPLVWKAGRDRFGGYTDAQGRSRLASENSEAALCWNLFRSLEKAGRLDIVTRALGLDDEFQVLYWYHPWDSPEPLPEIRQALQRVEPRKGYQTEVNIMLKGRRCLVLVETNLGKPGAQLRNWERTGNLSIPASYEAPLKALLVNQSNLEETMRRFYTLLRCLVLANELSRPEVWGLEPHLLAIVNDLNRHASRRSHAEEFAEFRRCLRWPGRQSHLLTWQTLLARAEASFEPAVRPLLNHAKRLTYLQPISE